MKLTIPKGSYHEYCRSKRHSKQTTESNQLPLSKLTHEYRKGKNVQDFDTFETYLMHLQHKENDNRMHGISHSDRPLTTDHRGRPKTYEVKR